MKTALRTTGLLLIVLVLFPAILGALLGTICMACIVPMSDAIMHDTP